MEKEMEVLERDLRSVDESHGTQVLNLVLARGYFLKLFGNPRVNRYLGQPRFSINCGSCPIALRWKAEIQLRTTGNR
jgi:hypothetical protein